MNQPSFDVTERLAYPLFAKLAARFDPVCKGTFWNFQRADGGEPQYIETALGQRQVTGRITGVGRVADVFWQGRDQIDVTFSHGKFASVFVYRTVIQTWLPSGNGQAAAPLIEAPNKAMLHEFLANAFSVLLLPRIQNREQVAIPKISRGQLLHYEILATDPDAREGVAVRLERA